MDGQTSLLYNLPEEIIIMIFELCDVNSLIRLATTCKKFNRIILNEDSVWRQGSLSVFASNMASVDMQKRCKPILSYKERCLVSREWYKGLGKRVKLAHFKKCMPWMVLERDYLFFSKGKTVLQYKRADNGDVVLKPTASAIPCKDDIAKFAVNENEVVCAGRDGKLVRLDKYNLRNIHSLMGHSADLLSVDTKRDIIVTGCKDGFVKVWKANADKTESKGEVQLNNRIISMAIMPSNTSFFVGTPGTKSVHPLKLFDLESCKHLCDFGSTFRNGAGILDIYPECHFTALTCGYDSTVQLWDIRCPQKSVSLWNEPYDTCLYCVQSDHNMTVITGAACHAAFLLWDKRVREKPIKTYYVPLVEKPGRPVTSPYHKGPVFSATFDATHIFVALEKSLLQYSYM